ncbi:hypothetical protein GORHZ_171_00510 [Gordonia rhizosphera NBRC 16068]|uniref:Uncharacterized protein n=1 Tax=Gordonia rhizosphera NBRC 16068 TaxID=1108045 RepID=K6V849_9ACTN|nr:hypothetical protein GORHZ_171_00510 [Gordonia rhizosphera NBRC 16068]
MSVSRRDVERGFREPIEAAGRSIGDDALRAMVDAAGGYPFLLQRIGAQTWRLHPDQTEITVVDAEEGNSKARRRSDGFTHS